MEDTTMRIDLNRLSVLAGLPTNGSNLREGAMHDQNEMRNKMAEEETDEGMRNKMAEKRDEEDMSEEDLEELMHQNEMRNKMAEEETDEMAGMDMNEMIEVDEVMLVQELRRAKRLMNESRNRKAKKQALFENNLKRIIDEEVQNVMAEMNLNSDWVYGRRKPTRSRKGYTHQGSFLPGMGFKR